MDQAPVNLNDPNVRYVVYLRGHVLTVQAHNADGTRHIAHCDVTDPAVQRALFQFVYERPIPSPTVQPPAGQPTVEQSASGGDGGTVAQTLPPGEARAAVGKPEIVRHG